MKNFKLLFFSFLLISLTINSQVQRKIKVEKRVEKKTTKRLNVENIKIINDVKCLSPIPKNTSLICKRKSGINNTGSITLNPSEKCTKEDLILKIDNTSNSQLGLPEWTKFSVTIKRNVASGHWEGVTSNFVYMNSIINNGTSPDMNSYTALYRFNGNNNLLYFNLYNEPILKPFLDSFFSGNNDNILKISIRVYINNIEKCAKTMEVSPFHSYKISDKYKQGGLIEYSETAKKKY